jgi:hypothetical protein
MTNDSRMLIEEHNIISLRTAVVIDSDGFVALQLMPASSSMDEKQNVHKTEYYEWLNSFQTVLYQHISSGSRIPSRNIKELAFEKPPELKLLWTDSGNSVAVYLNGEPWAFIDEKTQKAYSKGVFTSRLGPPWTPPERRNHWDQQAFERTFINAD